MSSFIMGKESQKSKGFTIVELLVVIVVLAILSVISVVIYTGVTQKAVSAKTNADASNAKKSLELYKVKNGTYPSAQEFKEGCDADPSSDAYICLGASNNGTNADIEVNYDGCIENGDCDVYVTEYYEYEPICGGLGSENPCAFDEDPFTYELDVTPIEDPDLAVEVDPTSDPEPNPKTCPDGFIVVPGSATYNTKDFCVMKYEAKEIVINEGEADQFSVPVSQPSEDPWIFITQNDAINISSDPEKTCDSCHLISEAEWLTIAENVLGVNSNWSNPIYGDYVPGEDMLPISYNHTVGQGYVYNGKAGFPDEVTDPDNNYSDTGSNAEQPIIYIHASGDISTHNNEVPGDARRRTLNLSNGEVIWDLSGNAYEWTLGKINADKEPGLTTDTSYWVSKEWKNSSIRWDGFPSSSAVPPIATTWNSTTQFIGNLTSNYNDASTDSKGFVRGGANVLPDSMGVLSLNLSYNSNFGNPQIGFRLVADKN